MPDVLIRGLSDEAVARVEAAAAELGISRNEYLRRQLEVARSETEHAHLTLDDLRRASTAAEGLLDPETMGAAWR
ncbi:MAG: hypothetical protein ABI435_05605 [Pseudolysinimonas sp.]